MNTFRDMLIYLRKSHGLSQRELAAKLKISPSAIGMYESGTRYPSREQEEAIADFFNINLDTLRGKEPVSEKYNAETAHLLMTIQNDAELKNFIREYMKLNEEQKHIVSSLVHSLLPNH